MIKELFGSALGLALGASLIFIAIFASAAFGAQLDVNCNMQGAEAVQDAIDNANVGDHIVVVGNCTGTSLVVSTDQLTLLGQGSAKLTGDGVAPAITVTAAQVTIEGWNLIDGGADHGIVVRAAGSAFVHDIASIAGNDGIQSIESAYVDISNVAGINVNDDAIFVASNGSALISGTNISDNPDDGVVAASGGVVILSGGNTIENNGDFGLIIAAGQAIFNGANTVQGNRVDVDCRSFARIIVFQSVTSSSGNAATSDCDLIEGFAPVFEGNALSLVDCDAGETITKALANGLTNITVRGLCDEHVFVTASNVTIQGENLGPGGVPVDGINTDLGPGIGTTALFVNGAQGVNLVNLKVTGGRNGVVATRNAAVQVTNGDFAPFAGAGGRFGLVVTDNGFLNMTNSAVGAGSGGAILAARNGTMRIFNTDISAGATDKIALTLNDSVAYLYGVDITGSFGAHFNSRVAFFDAFLGTFYGNSVIDTTSGPGQCSRYSNVSAFPANIVVNPAAVPFTNVDIFAFDDCRATIE